MVKDRLCNSYVDKLEKSNSETMSCPLKVTTDNDGAREEIAFIYVDVHTQIALIAEDSSSNYNIAVDGVYTCMHILHTYLKKIGTTV